MAREPAARWRARRPRLRYRVTGRGMEPRANYILVGAFALVVLLGFAIAAVWLARVELRESTVRYDVFFEGSVTGLRPGNAVRYRGVPVGTVAAMQINPRNVEQVQVTLSVPAGTPIKADTVASLELEEITGVAYVQLSGGTQEAPPLAAQPGQERQIGRASCRERVGPSG